MSQVSTAQHSGGDESLVSVVVPAKNESGNIAPLVAEIAAALAGRAFEIVYVNDGSTDATEQELRALMAAANPASKLLRAIHRHPHRGSYGAWPAHRHNRWRRAERSGFHARTDRRIRRSACWTGRRATCWSQGDAV